MPSYNQWHHHLIFGLADLTGEVDVDAVCPNGVAMIHDRHSFVNGLVGALTFGIYQPTTVTVFCNSERSDAGQYLEVMMDEEFLSGLEETYPDIREWADAMARGKIEETEVRTEEPIRVVLK